MHILILGGTTEASALAALLAQRNDIRATLSLAGRTLRPVLPPIPHRIGGFGGSEGLAAWIRENNVTAVIDATHPFARRMPFNVAEAARKTHIPLLALVRPAWERQAGDQWTQVADHAEAIAALGAARKRVFLTVGRLELEAYAAVPQHFYLARSIDPVEEKPLRDAMWLTSRPPFTVEGERALMREYAINTVITKNSGGGVTSAKLTAARELGVPVILINRPKRPAGECVATAEAALKWISRQKF
jgi:precorrin-6A/cobalt-precorrin-6A reductase